MTSFRPMEPMLTTLGPLLAFMLLPVWIPVLTVAGGALVDRVSWTR